MQLKKIDLVQNLNTDLSLKTREIILSMNGKKNNWDKIEQWNLGFNKFQYNFHLCGILEWAKPRKIINIKASIAIWLCSCYFVSYLHTCSNL